MAGLIWLFGQGATGDVDITLTTVFGSVSIEEPEVAINIDLTLDTVAAAVSIATPVTYGDANVIAGGPPGWGTGEWGSMPWGGEATPVLNLAVVSIPTPVVTTGADISLTLTTVTASVSVPTPTISTAISLTLTTVTAVAAVPTPTVSTVEIGPTFIPTFRYRAPVGYKSRRTGSRMPRGRFEPSVRI